MLPEVQKKTSISACTAWKEGFVQVAVPSSSSDHNNPWIFTTKKDGQTAVHLPGEEGGGGSSSTTKSSLLRLAPLGRKQRNLRWNESHFHDRLRLPDNTDMDMDNAADSCTTNSKDGLVVTFQAKARESIVIALSTHTDYSKELMYEIQLGAAGNTTTLLKQRRKNSKVVSKSISSRVCQADTWISYWICLNHNTIYAGVGEIPGQECIGML